jgi:hypothetical protein
VDGCTRCTRRRSRCPRSRRRAPPGKPALRPGVTGSRSSIKVRVGDRLEAYARLKLGSELKSFRLKQFESFPFKLELEWARRSAARLALRAPLGISAAASRPTVNNSHAASRLALAWVYAVRPRIRIRISSYLPPQCRGLHSTAPRLTRLEPTQYKTPTFLLILSTLIASVCSRYRFLQGHLSRPAVTFCSALCLSLIISLLFPPPLPLDRPSHDHLGRHVAECSCLARHLGPRAVQTSNYISALW